jgi:hypothetical protein
MMGDRVMAAEAMANVLAMAARMSPLDDYDVAIGDISREIADIAVVAIEAAPALNPAEAAADALQRVCRLGDGEDETQKRGRPHFPPKRRRRAKRGFVAE